MRRLSGLSPAIVLAIILAACETPSAEGECRPGLRDVCACPGGDFGVSTCSDAGERGACLCEAACRPESDADFCARQSWTCGMATGSDNCGAVRSASCGGCSGDEVCGAGAPNVCGRPPCVAESDAALCARAGKDCGAFSAVDDCGAARSAECGSCLGDEECGALTANVCDLPPCVAESDAALCARLDKECGAISASDNCGQARSADCGGCSGAKECGARLPNACDEPPCAPESALAFCLRLGAECGTLSAADNCGAPRSEDCGECDAPAQCGALAPNACDEPPCAPEDDLAFCARLGAECGALSADDDCGAPRSADCGRCAGDEECGALAPNACDAPPCEHESDAAFCARAGKDCGVVSGADNCGAPRTSDCGSCGAGEVCGAERANVCGVPPCAPESDAAFCTRAGARCGSVSAPDNCGTSRTAACGLCSGGTVCDAEHQCVPPPCTPESDASFCARAGKECGSFSALDNCKLARTADCGSCTSPESCGAVTANTCGCVADSDAVLCARAGKDCGTLATIDNCGRGRSARCGTCTSPESCGAIIPNVCDCVAESDLALCARLLVDCGSVSAGDNCGAARSVDCGGCSGGELCGLSAPNVCSPPPCAGETEAQLCARLGRECGVLSATDVCGTPRTVSCGSCSGSEVCGALAANLCDVPPPCVPESDAAFCARRGKECGAASGLDNCGAARSVASCGSCAVSRICGSGGRCLGSCGDLALAGCCDGANLYWCQDDAVHVAECGTAPCGWNGTRGYYDCGHGGAGAGQPEACSDYAFCRPESDAELCQAAGKDCGVLALVDGCGAARDAWCGSCAGDEACSDNVCAAPACESDAALCARLGVACGPLAADDLCGEARSVASCGACGVNETCSQGGACAPACGSLGATGCCSGSGAVWCEDGAVVSEACAWPSTCGWHAAEALYACGGSGADPSGVNAMACDAFAFCVAESDAELCARAGRSCGEVSALDNCGAARTADCGACAAGELCAPAGSCEPAPCGDLGVAGCCDGTRRVWCQGGALVSAECGGDGCGWSARAEVYDCGGSGADASGRHAAACDAYAYCQGESDAAFCARVGVACGAASGLDDCGQARDVASCGSCPGGLACGGGQCLCTPDASLCLGDVALNCDGAGVAALATCGAGQCAVIGTTSYCMDSDFELVAGSVGYVARSANATRTDWGEPETRPLPAVLMISYLRQGDAFVSLGETVSAADGSYQLRVAKDASSQDLVVIWLVHGDEAGDVVMAVAKPKLSGGEHEPADVATADAELWSYAVAAETLAGAPDIVIGEADHSSAAALFDQQRAVYDDTHAVFGARGAKLVMWHQPGVTWSCGACFNELPSSVGGASFTTSIWIGHDADAAYWSDAVTVHEAGHWVMSAYGTSPNEGGTHCLGTPTLPGQAWSEGFATFFSSLQRENRYYYDKQGGSFFWADLIEMSFGGGGSALAMTLPSADARGYPDAGDPVLQLFDENVVAAMSYAIARGLSPSGCGGACPLPRLLDEGELLMDALVTPRMNTAPFARDYVRHLWTIGASCEPTNIFPLWWVSTPMFADYVDAVRCLGAGAGIDIDAIVGGVILDWPYPIGSDPICE